MLIIGVDSAEYRIANEFLDVDRLDQDVGTLHTIPSWATMFDRNGTRYERPDGYQTPVRADYVWNGCRDDWTVANLPISFPPYTFNSTVPDSLAKPVSADERVAERQELSRIISESETKHTLVVLNGLDALSHKVGDMGTIYDEYERVCRWVSAHDPDVILSDHGFEGFGCGDGVNDHSPNAIVSGIDADSVTDVGPAIARIA